MSDIQEQITPLERAKEITSESKTEDKKNNGTEKPQYFYRLLLTQLAVIFISTFLPTKKCFFYTITNYPRSHITFDEYCRTYEKCRQSYYYYNAHYHQQDQNQFEVWKNAVVQENTVYTTLYYFSLILFPSLLILQSVFRNCQLIKQKQKLFYYLQFPSMSLFIQLCTHLIKQTENSNIFYHLRILLIYQIGIVTFFYMNQKCLKWQLEFKSTTQKLVNYSFILICLKEILNCISLNQSNWIPHILFILYTQVHLLHLNANLFNENTKYAIHNDSVIQLIKQKLQSLFDVQDVYKEVAKTYFVISNRMMYSWVVGIIVAMIFRDWIFNLQNYFALSGIFLILIWDTSLVSTSSKLTLQDQYQAASLYFLDFMQPIRNIILALLA